MAATVAKPVSFFEELKAMPTGPSPKAAKAIATIKQGLKLAKQMGSELYSVQWSEMEIVEGHDKQVILAALGFPDKFVRVQSERISVRDLWGAGDDYDRDIGWTFTIPN